MNVDYAVEQLKKLSTVSHSSVQTDPATARSYFHRYFAFSNLKAVVLQRSKQLEKCRISKTVLSHNIVNTDKEYMAICYNEALKLIKVQIKRSL